MYLDKANFPDFLDFCCSVFYIGLIISVYTVIYHIPSLSDAAMRVGKFKDKNNDEDNSKYKRDLGPGILVILSFYLFKNVPKKWFGHFYITALFCTALSGLAHVLIFGHIRSPTILSLFFLHISRRIFESYQVEAHSNATMILAHYIAGLSFYFVTSISITFISSEQIEPLSFFWITMFLIGQVIQFHSHSVLALLRKNSQNVSSSAYLFPRDGPFRYSSNPHYAAEILIYFSLLTLSRSWSSLFCFCWVTFNLSILGYKNHAWYGKTFLDDESQQLLRKRSILFPYIL